MDPPQTANEVSPFPDWEREQIAKVIAHFPGLDAQELSAELAITVLTLMRRRSADIRDWKAYLTQALFNKASSLARKWRAQQRREISMDFNPLTATPPVSSEEALSRQQQARRELARVRRFLGADDYAFLKHLADTDENQSRVARERGIHRNTVRRRRDRLQRRLRDRPIENVSGRSHRKHGQAARTRLRLTAAQRRRLIQDAQSARGRKTFKARLILALAAGESYTRIAQMLKTTPPTIARWRSRFETNGLEGLKSKHQGKRPKADVRSRLADWLRSTRPSRRSKARWSYRKIGHELGVSKSTVHRILTDGRRRGSS